MIDETVFNIVTKDQEPNICNDLRRLLSGDFKVLLRKTPATFASIDGLQEIPDLTREALLSRLALEYHERKRTTDPSVIGSHGRQDTSFEEIPSDHDELFEKFLSKELADSLEVLRAEARMVARVAYYGTHFDGLFPNEPSVGSGIGQRNMFHQIISDDGADLGDSLYKRFIAQYPERVKRYRIVYNP